jgi:pyruvate dehydrogenase (quinone)
VIKPRPQSDEARNAMTTVAVHLVEALVNAGVRRIYGIVGDSLNSIVDAVHHNKKIEWIHVRHEEAGAFAASAEAQLTGNLAVCRKLWTRESPSHQWIV